MTEKHKMRKKSGKTSKQWQQSNTKPEQNDRKCSNNHKKSQTERKGTN